MRLRRAAVVIPIVRGSICGALGALALIGALALKGPNWGFVPFALFVYSIPLLLTAIVYFVAAFLLARRWIVWRALGALLDTAPSLLIAWALVAEGMVLSEELPFLLAFAAIWAGAVVPVVVGMLEIDQLLKQIPGL